MWKKMKEIWRESEREREIRRITIITTSIVPQSLRAHYQLSSVCLFRCALCAFMKFNSKIPLDFILDSTETEVIGKTQKWRKWHTKAQPIFRHSFVHLCAPKSEHRAQTKMRCRTKVKTNTKLYAISDLYSIRSMNACRVGFPAERLLLLSVLTLELVSVQFILF